MEGAWLGAPVTSGCASFVSEASNSVNVYLSRHWRRAEPARSPRSKVRFYDT